MIPSATTPPAGGASTESAGAQGGTAAPARAPEPGLSTPAARFARMVLIRRFEERVLEMFGEGKLSGTTHAYMGQEAGAVGVIAHLRPGDLVFSNHRCHGHYLAWSDDVHGLLGELMGRASGVCGGLGGSQHLCRDGFYSNGVQGSYMPILAGLALAEKLRGTRHVSVGFIGDGTLGEGATYEALNLMSLLAVPALVVIENNRYAQTTPIELNLAGSIAARPRAFGIETAETASTDVEEIAAVAGRLVAGMRADGRPRALVIHTYRFGPHSKGDDHRPAAEIAEARLRDPLDVAGARIDAGERSLVESAVRARLADVERLCERDPVLAWTPR